MYPAKQRYFAEFLGTAFLLMTVVGSGIMAENLANGNDAIALLGNTVATGAILVVLITVFAPVSGAHFNPAVTMVFTLKGDISARDCFIYMAVQTLGAVAGTFLAHIMFDIELIQTSEKLRTGSSQWMSELIATFGLVIVIFESLKVKRDVVAINVGLYITAAYWFTASTSFANPSVTIARSLTNTFSGIFPEHVPAFIFAQIVGAILALIVCQKILLIQSNNTFEKKDND